MITFWVYTNESRCHLTYTVKQASCTVCICHYTDSEYAMPKANSTRSIYNFNPGFSKLFKALKSQSLDDNFVYAVLKILILIKFMIKRWKV